MTNDRIYTLSDALFDLYPEGGWSVSFTYDSIIWAHATKTKPTESVLTAKVKELQDAYDSIEYQRKRDEAYPDWKTQMDMQYWDSVNGTTTWKDAIAKVKSDNPKPS